MTIFGTAQETGDAIPRCCSMCLIVPDDQSALVNRGEFHPYWLCRDRKACGDRTWKAQSAASGQHQDLIDPAPGAAQEGTEPATPPQAGDGQPLAVPGAEPLPVDATKCGLTSWDGTPCGLDAGHSPFVRHAPARGKAHGAGAA